MTDDIEKYSRHAVMALIPGLFLLVAIPMTALAQDVPPSPQAPAEQAKDLAQPPEFEEEVTPFSDPEDDAQTTEISPEMQEALESIGEVIDALDENAERQGNNWQLTIDERPILVVTDVSAGRMRTMTPIAAADALDTEALMRLMQANFDTALDARYAVAQGLVWGTFIHPLDGLEQREFASGLLQTKALADTFGTTFSSGVLNYGGGDSAAIIDEQVQELLDELEKKQTI